MKTITATPPGNTAPYSCHAFAIQVKTLDTTKMQELLTKAFPPTRGPVKYIPYLHQHRSPTSFAKSVHMQANIKESHWDIAVQGLTVNQMFHLEPTLHQEFPLLSSTYETQRTNYLNTAGEPIGRYNFLSPKTNCKECTHWETLEGPKEIEEALIAQNQKHFGQAQGTQQSVSPFKEAIDWDASSHYAKVILEGGNPFHDEDIDPIQQLMIKHLQRTTQLDSITDKISEEDWTRKMLVWNENTSTSPSGMHLGHHKALLRPFREPENYNRENPDAPPLTEDLRQKLLSIQISLMKIHLPSVAPT